MEGGSGLGKRRGHSDPVRGTPTGSCDGFLIQDYLQDFCKKKQKINNSKKQSPPEGFSVALAEFNQKMQQNSAELAERLTKRWGDFTAMFQPDPNAIGPKSANPTGSGIGARAKDEVAGSSAASKVQKAKTQK